MKNVKKPIILAITFVIAGLLIVSTISIPAIKTTVGNNDVNIVKMENELQTLQLKVTDLNLPFKPMPKRLGYPEFAYGGDQIHPALARSTDNGYMAALRDDSYEDILWAFTPEDGGFFSTGGYYPSVKLWDGTRFFGTFVPESDDSNGGIIYLFETSDNTNLEAYTLVGWDWSDNGWYDILDIELACDNSKESWEWGFISLVASTTFDVGYYDAPFITYQTSEDGYATISWYMGVDGCAHTDNIIDHSTYKTYAVYDWYSSQGGRWELLIRLDYYDDWEKQGAMYEYFDYSTDYQHPAVSSYDDNIVVVFETDENNNKDIKCFYGTNLENLKESFVVNTNDDEILPDVQHVEGTTFLCTFIKNGNLYGSLSENAGKTWGTPWMISEGNGEVIEEYKTSDLCEKGLQVMWEEMGQDIDIWINWAPDNDPPGTPSINGETKGEPEVAYDYTFSSIDPEGEDVEFYIDWDDGTIENWFGPYSSGADVVVEHTWNEESTFLIRVKTRDVNGLESLWGTLKVSTPANIQLINPVPGYLYASFTGTNGIPIWFFGNLILFINRDVEVTAQVDGADTVEFTLTPRKGGDEETVQADSQDGIFTYNFGKIGIGFYSITAEAYHDDNIICSESMDRIFSLSP